MEPFCPRCGLKLKVKWAGSGHKTCKNGHMFVVFERESKLQLIECLSTSDKPW